MKKVLLIVSILCLSLGMTQAQNQRCGTMEHHDRLKAEDPGYEDRLNGIEQLIQNRMANDKSWRTSGTVTIPVVFHILYSTNNATQNISNARVMAQMDVLNQDFAGTNVDVINVPSVFQSAVANTGIQFCLAVQDPSGNTTDGIIRKQTTVTSWSTNNNIKFDASGGDNAWPNTSYLNIWVGNLGSGLLGYAQFPGGPANTDGIVVLNGAVGGPGALGTASPYHRGRTATHEIGHWLNLRHIWGDNNCGNDFVADTPTQQGANFSCPSFPHVTSCTGNPPNGDMFMNYMDYVDDDCMIMFSNGQGARMNACITTVRAAILNSLGCVPVVAGAPTANFSASATNIPVGTSINFTDLSTGAPASWAWTFNGGTPLNSNIQNPMNILYNAPGLYTVSLTVTNANGTDTETKTGYITVTSGGGGGCDTLNNFPLTGTPTILLSGGAGAWGYVSGHNDYLDKGKADFYTNSSPANYVVTGAFIGFGVATASNTTNTFNVKVWDANGAGTSPSTVLGTTTATYATAETDASNNDLTFVSFIPPVSLSGDFFVGIDFTYTAGDTLAIIHTADGEVTPGTAWEQFSTNDWHAYSETPTSWGIDVAHLIIPILCDPLGENEPLNSGVLIYPNPSHGTLIIHNTNAGSGNALIRVLNVMGQEVMSRNITDFNGTHYLNLSELSNGIYFVEIQTGKSNLVQKLVLENK